MSVIEPAAQAVLRAFALDIKNAWKERSSAELELRTAEVARATAPPTEIDPDRLRRILERGAVSGAVLPLDLTGGLDLDDPELALDALVRSFDSKPVEGRWRWTLRSAVRSALLSRLYGGDELDPLLEEARSIATDDAGELLRELVAERSPRVHQEAPRSAMSPAEVKARQAELQRLIQALDWLKNLEPFKPFRAAVRRESAAINQLVSCDRLLSRGFVGRERQLKRLFAFAAGPSKPGAAIPLLEVAGIGGAGKSTLLAKMIRRQATGTLGAAPILVHLDLDRIAFRLGGVLELSFEVTRQIGVAYAPAADALAELRDDIRSELAEFVEEGAEASRTVETRLRAAYNFQHRASAIIAQFGLIKRSIMLLLDTFEEWQRRDPHRAQYAGIVQTGWLQEMQEWLSGLRHSMGLAGLRVIISGRAPAGMDDRAFDRQRPIVLGPLPPRDRLTLLEQQYGFSDAEARKLARIAGGNPLSLHLAARQLRVMEAGDRARFLDGTGPVSKRLGEAVRQSVLYDRFLDHVRDEDARKLAHPGLALRFVTPDLIRQVLAGPCGLGEIDERRAGELFELLEEEVWLVERSGDRLVHRPNVRRTMLRMMKADPDQTEAVARVHQRAAQWYAKESGPGAEAERRYHELMVTPPRSDLDELSYIGPGDSWRASVPGYIKELIDAADDLPRRLAVQLRFLAGAPVTPSAVRHFPADKHPLLIDQIGLGYCRSGRAEAAVGLLDMVEGAEPAWASEARVAAGRWGKRGPEAQPAFFHGLDQEQFAAVPYKYLLIEQFLSDSLDDWAWVQRVVTDALSLKLASSVDTPSIETLYFLRVTGPDRGDSEAATAEILGRWGSRYVQPRHPMAWLRYVIAGGGLGKDVAARPGDAAPRTVLGALFPPDPAEILRKVDLLAPGLGPELEAMLEEFGHDRYSSDALLSEIPRRMQRLLESATWELPIEQFMIRDVRSDVDLPELRPAIRLALADAFPRRGDLGKLGEIALPMLPIRPIDFRPDRLRRDGCRRPLETRSRVVEYIDRSGVMPQVLDAWVDARPASELLRRVRDGRRRLAEACAALEGRVRTAERLLTGSGQ